MLVLPLVSPVGGAPGRTLRAEGSRLPGGGGRPAEDRRKARPRCCQSSSSTGIGVMLGTSGGTSCASPL